MVTIPIHLFRIPLTLLITTMNLQVEDSLSRGLFLNWVCDGGGLNTYLPRDKKETLNHPES